MILIPEIPYDIHVVADAIKRRTKRGSRFTILAVAEGAISKEDASLKKKELKAKRENEPVYPSISYKIGAELEKLTGQEVRVTVPGHTQRGGSPCAYDRVLSTRLGAAAGRKIVEGKFGILVGIKNNEITEVPLKDVAGKLKMVDQNSSILREARDAGICFGDEL